MNKCIVLIALLLFLKPVFPVVDYVLNYDYIANVLCENKAKPELKCNGKCQLMKNLAKVSDEEKPINSDKKDNSKQEIEVLFFQTIEPLFVQRNFFSKNKSVKDIYTNLYFHLVNNSVFRPPTIIS